MAVGKYQTRALINAVIGFDVSAQCVGLCTVGAIPCHWILFVDAKVFSFS